MGAPSMRYFSETLATQYNYSKVIAIVGKIPMEKFNIMIINIRVKSDNKGQENLSATI